MNENDKRDLLEIFDAALMRQHHGCPYGIDAATAHELVDFADAWKNARKTALITLIGALVTSVLAALLAGLRSIIS